MRKQTIKPAVFDGTNYLKTDGDIFGGAELSALSLVCSFKFNSAVGYRTPMSKRNCMGFGLPSNNRLTAYINTNDAGSDAIDYNPLTLGEVYHIATIYDKDAIGDSLVMYINGEQVASSNDKRVPLASSIYALGIGGNDGGINKLDGDVYDGLVYTQALTAAQVKRLYNQGLNISASSLKHLGLDQGLICAYALDSENEGIDLSGNENHLSNINNVSFDGSAIDTLHTGIQTQNTLKADGTQYLTGAKISEVGEDFFFSCFAKFDDLAYLAEQFIFNEASKISLKTGLSGGQIEATFASSLSDYSIVSSTALSNDKLYHFAIDVDSTALIFSFYVDGVLINSLVIDDTDRATGLTAIYSDSTSAGKLRGSLRNIYFGKKAFGQQGVDWFRNKGVPRDLSIMPSTYANEAISIYEPTLLNGGADISGNGNDCAIVGTPAYTEVEEVQKISNYMLPQGVVPQDGLLAWVDGETKNSNKADTSITVVDSNTTTDSINGVPAIGIDETNYIRIGLSAVPKPASFTTFVVARRDDDSAFSPLHTVCDSIGADATMWGTAMFNADSASAYSCYHSSTTSALSSRTYHTTPSLINEPIVLTQRYTAGTNEIEIFINGVKDSTVTVGGVFSENTGDAFDMVIGKFGEYLFNTTLTFKGAVGDFGVYNRAVTDEEMTEINDYLTNKYGV